MAWRTVIPANQVGRSVTVTVNPVAGQTRIRIDESLKGVAGGLFGGLLGGLGGASFALGAGLGMGALHSVLAMLAIQLGGVGSAFGMARAFLKLTYKGRKTELEQLLDRLATYAEESIRTGRRPRLAR